MHPSQSTFPTGGVLLEACPVSFSINLHFREDGKDVGDMDRALVRESARVDLDDGSYSFYRDGLVDGDYLLDGQGRTLL